MALTILLVIAAVLVLIDETRSRGSALTSWAVLLVIVVLLWGRL